MIPTDVRPYFEAANTAHLATVSSDGAPHSVPLWVGVHGDKIAFLTSPASRKARNLEADPRVAISVTRADRPSAMATVRGRVVEHFGGEQGWRLIDELAQKYIGQPYPLRTDREIFLVEVEHAAAMEF